MSKTDLCDFCSDEKPVRRFEAAGFEVPGHRDPKLESRGAWLACEECGRLIDGEWWDALQIRATNRLTAKYRGLVSRAELRAQVLKAHGLFREHRVTQ